MVELYQSLHMIVYKKKLPRFFARHYLYLFLVIVFLVNILSGYWYLKQKNTNVPITRASDENLFFTRERIQNLQQKWTLSIKEYGAKEAYQRYLKETSTYPLKFQHFNAHLMGEILYDELGLNGLEICDNSFSYGCYHTFFAKAISDKGTTIIPSLNTICEKKFGQKSIDCTHGLGHGILYHLGEDHLTQALDLCRKYSWRQETGGCVGGVFMEYNLRLMQNPAVSRQSVRPTPMNDLHAPCNKTPTIYKKACYYEMPQWWAMVISDNVAYNYSEIGKLCEEIANTDQRVACYKGAGLYAGTYAQYDPSLTKSFCKEMLSEEGVQECLINASWAYLGQPSKKHLAPSVCDELSKTLRASCSHPDKNSSVPMNEIL